MKRKQLTRETKSQVQEEIKELKVTVAKQNSPIGEHNTIITEHN